MSHDDHQTSPGAAGAALQRRGRPALCDLPMAELLQAVADSAKAVMPGSPEVSIVVRFHDRRVTITTTGPLATDLDEAQYGQGQRPCLSVVATTYEPTEIPDSRTERSATSPIPRPRRRAPGGRRGADPAVRGHPPNSRRRLPGDDRGQAPLLETHG